METEPLLLADWPAPRSIVAGVTTRVGGLSQGRLGSLNLGAHVGDEPSVVAANRDLLQGWLPDQRLHWLDQVHGTEVVTRTAAGVDEHVVTADAQVSFDVNQALMIMTADCLPVLFCSADAKVIAAAHAGWRGLAGGILENTLAAMAVAPKDVLVWIGPGISQAHFEVGDEVRAAFCQNSAEAEDAFARNERGRWQADLKLLARQRLLAAGVSQIFGLPLCTYADSERFFSHRRENPCGRMASFITRQDTDIA